MEIQQKTDALRKIAQQFNRAGITWAIGGSMLLYFKGIATAFRDIDILVTVDDVEAAKAILLEMGSLAPMKSDSRFQTKAFYEFTVDGVDIDVLAGFVIVKDGIEHDCALREQEIESMIELNGVRIPLHSVAAWRRYYVLMDKPQKVQMIDAVMQ